jgi:hypothetical protein
MAQDKKTLTIAFSSAVADDQNSMAAGERSPGSHGKRHNIKQRQEETLWMIIRSAR